ncbi:glycosyltransferase family 2 protein [Bradyrhizobium sp. CCBAU 051011]|uniref:glycosyltransferase family 2 protein n=1 Tax=Bradyrhizobium sp. CCBAU 051011 TaxID=858422 RepID=UPI001FEEBDC3|nr:glycosyltransferase family 2 protein [Bradyrhizobium sp. CCBAU 051011]
MTTLYQSASTIDEFCRRVLAAAEFITDDIELVMVNDGSPDDSLARALALHEADPRVVVIDLARNFGHHKALMTGLAHATGDLVFLIDSDLEEEPELLTPFHERLMQGDCDVVFGVQESRRGGWFDRVAGELFFSLIDALSDQKIPRNNVVARLMTRDYVRALVRHLDREFMMIHLMQLAGYRQVPVVIRKHDHSPSTYSFRMRTEMAIKFLTTTSTRLLYLILYLGISIFALSLFVIVYFVGRYFASGVGVDGFTSQIVSIWFLGGLITLILGIFGIYIANILAETKRRPYAVVRRVHRTPAAQSEPKVRKLDQAHSVAGAVDAHHHSRFVAGQERS